MPKRSTLPTLTRIPVSLNEEDNNLFIRLRAAMEKRVNERLSVAEIIRIALRTQAKAEGIIR